MMQAKSIGAMVLGLSGKPNAWNMDGGGHYAEAIALMVSLSDEIALNGKGRLVVLGAVFLGLCVRTVTGRLFARSETPARASFL